MSTPIPEDTLPTNSHMKFSYEYAVDVDISDGTGDPAWQRVRFIDQVAPAPVGVTVAAPTYEDKGSANNVRVSENWTLSFGVQAHVVDGAYLPEVQALLDRTAPDVQGEDAKIALRYYDNPGNDRDPVTTDSFSGLATVEMTRGQTGASGEVEMFNFTLTGVGKRSQTPHPDAA